ncbi:MAG: hypothetical protein ABIO70_30490 [Pseudomonadota bacterium]
MLGLLALLLCLVTLPVRGQEGAGRHLVEGPTREVVPSLDLGFGYDGNVWHTPDAVGAPLLRLSPAVEAQIRRPDGELDLDARYTLRLYAPGTGLFAYSRWMDSSVDLVLAARESRPVGFELEAQAGVDDPQQVPARTRLRAALEPTAVFRPASAIDLRLGAALSGEEYREGLGASASGGLGPRLEIGPTWEAKWRFFPRTAVVIEGSWLLDLRVGATGTLFDLMGGLRGRLTPRLTLALMAGYGAANVGGVPALGGPQRLLVLARIERALHMGSASLTYRKGFSDPHFTELVSFQRIDGQLKAQPWGRLGYALEASGRGEVYLGTITQVDLVAEVRPLLSWQASSRLAVTGGGGWWLRMSSDPASSWGDWEVLVGASGRW